MKVYSLHTPTDNVVGTIAITQSSFRQGIHSRRFSGCCRGRRCTLPDTCLPRLPRLPQGLLWLRAFVLVFVCIEFLACELILLSRNFLISHRGRTSSITSSRMSLPTMTLVTWKKATARSSPADTLSSSQTAESKSLRTEPTKTDTCLQLRMKERPNTTTNQHTQPHLPTQLQLRIPNLPTQHHPRTPSLPILSTHELKLSEIIYNEINSMPYLTNRSHWIHTLEKNGQTEPAIQ